jgi:hypothetical protein
MHAQTTPVLTVQGDRFAVNGQPRFLVFVSFFDALRMSRTAWQQDLDWLKDKVDGVRIFGNWHHWCDARKPPVEDGVIQANGTLNVAQAADLVNFIKDAADRGLLVDLSFDHKLNDASEIPFPQYKQGLARVTDLIRPYRNVLIDVENEVTFGPKLSDVQVAELVAAVHNGVGGISGDPKRLASASTESVSPPHITPAQAAAKSHDFIAYHTRGEGWPDDTNVGNVLTAIRSVTPKPIYLQEPTSFSDSPCPPSKETHPVPAHAAAAVTGAKRKGAAAWTFHNRNGFDLAAPGARLQTALQAVGLDDDLVAMALAARKEPTWGVPPRP